MGKRSPEDHARGVAARLRTKAIGTLSGIVNEQEPDGTVVEVLTLSESLVSFFAVTGEKDGITIGTIHHEVEGHHDDHDLERGGIWLKNLAYLY